MSVHDIIAEPLIVHKLHGSKTERRARVQALLELVGLDATHGGRYPYEFSGGQRQRIGVARALAVEPELIICDEPVSALDVSIQAQVINLLKQLQRRYELTYLFIAHDLAVVKHISDRVAVMYLGKIMEMADKTELFANPLHPYTRALLSSIPVSRPNQKKDRIILKGDLPSPSSPPVGCPFNTRCFQTRPRCFEDTPERREVAPGHTVACHFV
jgi:oligopeptide/dipeptide ABC transporter ATP-binding protein